MTSAIIFVRGAISFFCGQKEDIYVIESVSDLILWFRAGRNDAETKAACFAGDDAYRNASGALCSESH